MVMEFFRIESLTAFFQPVPTPSSSPTNGTDSIFVPAAENDVVNRLIEI